MKKFLLVLGSFFFIFSKCNKNDAPITPNNDTYLPSTVGSNWTYLRTSGTTNSTITYTVSSKDTSISSKTYQILTGSDNSKQYYSKVSNDYYTIQIMSGNAVELNFLKDNKNVNDTWSTSQTITGLSLPGGITSVTLNVSYTLQEKGSTRTVSGKSYTDVIKVKADLSVSLPLIGNMSFGYAEYYFSKNIGIIETNIQIANSAAGININQQDKLQSYVIK